MLSAFLLSLEITQSGVKKKRQKERERCRMTNLHEPDLNLQHYKFTAHPSLGWTMKTPRLISMASSVASRGPSSLLIWHFPSPWVNTFPARYCLASQPDEGGEHANMRFEFWQRMASQTNHVQNIRSVSLEWRDEFFFIKDTKSPGVTGKRCGKRHLPHLSSTLVCGILNQHHSAWSWQYNQPLHNTDERKASKRRKTASKALS